MQLISSHLQRPQRQKQWLNWLLTVNILCHPPNKVMTLVGNTTMQTPNKARGVTHRLQYCRNTSSTKSQEPTPQQEKREKKTHFSTGSSQINGSQRAIQLASPTHTHTLFGNCCQISSKEGREAEGYPQATPLRQKSPF